MTFDVRRFDIYRKVPKDLTQPTYTGAFISILCCVFILFLFLSELTGFIATEIVNELYVDDPDKDSGGKIEVSLNISLPNLHCDLVGLDIQDEMGRHEVGHIENSMKIPLNQGDGCRFEGEFSINKVPGNFHVSTHSATAQPQSPDMTHTIHKLAFGEKLQVQKVQGAFNALGGADKMSSNRMYLDSKCNNYDQLMTVLTYTILPEVFPCLPSHTHEVECHHILNPSGFICCPTVYSFKSSGKFPRSLEVCLWEFLTRSTFVRSDTDVGQEGLAHSLRS
uniref:Endoplasmic reticulum-Golgi intermediate compartment protein n=1 Tax=Haplochromis burtoni TaxID=8153 RepID=A0A3Q2WNZ8_HAPBU